MGCSGRVGTADGGRDQLLNVRRDDAALFGLCNLNVEWSEAAVPLRFVSSGGALEHRLDVGLAKSFAFSGCAGRRRRIRSNQLGLVFRIMYWWQTAHSWG